MKKIYFISTIALALVMSSGFVFAQVKPSNLNCKLAQNADNEWCEMEKGSSGSYEYIGDNSSDEADVVDCVLFTKVPVYKAKGEDVKKLQTILLENTPKLKVDGSFGPKTKAALIAYQKANELTQSGKVDDETLEFMQSNMDAECAS
jgi:hypothetical protein